jgi:hypothetical protein
MRNASRLNRSIWAFAAGLLMSCQVTWAEIPPSGYASLQDEAEEALQIEVIKVRGLIEVGNDAESHFTITAKIVCTARSASGLAPGETITIEYSTVLNRPRGQVGPAPIGILKRRVYAAYLNKSGAVYEPAAIGRSFVSSAPGAKPC